MNYENIPQELKALRQWACYRSYFDKATGKYKKVIISPVTTKIAMSNNPDTWADYAQAKGYCAHYRYNGLAFALSGGIAFIDLDRAVDKATGEIAPHAGRLLSLLPDTYAERSVSGTGIHILLKGSLPKDARKRNDEKGIEMYDTRRFVCMTGELLNGCAVLKDYADRIAEINYEFVGRRPPPAAYTAAPGDETDAALIAKILSSRQGAKFQSLLRGDIAAYGSHSSADFALAAILAWWTRDPCQIDRIIRASGLYRAKWDSPRGNATYGANLIAEALRVVTPRRKRAYAAVDAGEM
jgi:putative DNA primase/helicase